MTVLDHLGAVPYEPDLLPRNDQECEKLSFEIQEQQKGNWCWAAVAASVAHFFDPSSTSSQCGLANSQLGRDDCCRQPIPGECNKKQPLSPALIAAEVYRDKEPQAAAESVAEQEICMRRRPIAMALVDGNWVHFTVMYGIVAGSPTMMFLKDPAAHATIIALTYGSLIGSHYPANAKWSYSYYTEPSSRAPCT